MNSELHSTLHLLDCMELNACMLIVQSWCVQASTFYLAVYQFYFLIVLAWYFVACYLSNPYQLHHCIVQCSYSYLTHLFYMSSLFLFLYLSYLSDFSYLSDSPTDCITFSISSFPGILHLLWFPGSSYPPSRRSEERGRGRWSDTPWREWGGSSKHFNREI